MMTKEKRKRRWSSSSSFVQVMMNSFIFLHCTFQLSNRSSTVVDCFTVPSSFQINIKTNVLSLRSTTTTTTTTAFSTENSTGTDLSPSSPSSSLPVHTLILCRHGDSIWNGGEPGTRETFTGWTDVPLSAKGIREAQNTGRQVAELCTWGVIDACFTSTLQRAQMTAHYCLWAFASPPSDVLISPSYSTANNKAKTINRREPPRRYIIDYRLNERHYGALQGYVKEDVENGKYGHDPTLVKKWRRSWYEIPPLLEETDPRRIRELQTYTNICDGNPKNVPRGESLQQVANNRIRPFLLDVVAPTLQDAHEKRIRKKEQQEQRQKENGGTRQGEIQQTARDGQKNSSINGYNDKGQKTTTGSTIAATMTTTSNIIIGGTGLIVGHANSLRALIGIICQVENDPIALSKLESMRLPTGVPLVIKYQQRKADDGTTSFQVCDVHGHPLKNHHSLSKTTTRSSTKDMKGDGKDNYTDNNAEKLSKQPDLPVFPLSSVTQ